MNDTVGDDQAALVLEEPEPAPEATMELEGPPAPESAPAPRERKKTVKVTKRQLEMYHDPDDTEVEFNLDAIRPKSRDDCIDGERPCPFVGCKHHLYLEVNKDNGTITFNFPSKEVEELTDSCALDVAARGGVTLEDVGDMFNLTRERIRQIEGKALVKLKNNHRARAVREEMEGEDGKYSQGRYKSKYTPSPRAEVLQEPPPAPRPIVSSSEPEPPKPVWYVPPSEKPAMPAPPTRDEEEQDFELDETDEVEEDEEEEEDDEEPEAEEAEDESPPEDAPMSKKDRPIKVTELTEREALVVKHYLRLAEKEGQKPSPLAIAQACKLEGSSNASISASVCTALNAAQRKGTKLPYYDQKRVRATEGIVKKPSRSKKNTPPPPESVPAIQAEVVTEEAPSTAMVALSTPDAMKNVLLLEKEKLQKKLAAIDVLLTL